MSPVINKYDSIYTELSFERGGLFRLIGKNFPVRTVLYPGCSVHITPSFYFQHVVYIDNSDSSRDFFHDHEAVSRIILSRKIYKENPYFDFIFSDYKTDKAVDHQYDLLIALNAPDVLNHFIDNIKKNGYILMNEFQSSIGKAKDRNDLELLKIIRFESGTYRFVENEKGKMPSKNLRKKNNGLEYIDRDQYYFFKKL